MYVIDNQSVVDQSYESRVTLVFAALLPVEQF